MKKYRPPIACFLVLFSLTSLVYSQSSQLKLQQAGCTSPQCMVEAGKMLSVELMVGGFMCKIGRLYTVDIPLINVESSRIMKSLSRDYRGEIDGLLDLMGPIAEQLAAFVETAAVTMLNSGSLTVAPDSVPADIFLNENALGTSPLTIDNLLPGDYRLRLVADGYAPVEERVVI